MLDRLLNSMALGRDQLQDYLAWRMLHERSLLQFSLGVSVSMGSAKEIDRLSERLRSGWGAFMVLLYALCASPY